MHASEYHDCQAKNAVADRIGAIFEESDIVCVFIPFSSSLHPSRARLKLRHALFPDPCNSQNLLCVRSANMPCCPFMERAIWCLIVISLIGRAFCQSYVRTNTMLFNKTLDSARRAFDSVAQFSDQGFPKPLIWTHDWAGACERDRNMPVPPGFERSDKLLFRVRLRILISNFTWRTRSSRISAT